MKFKLSKIQKKHEIELESQKITGSGHESRIKLKSQSLSFIAWTDSGIVQFLVPSNIYYVEQRVKFIVKLSRKVLANVHNSAFPFFRLF